MPKFEAASGTWLNYEVAGADGADVFILLHANPFDTRMWMYQIAHFSQYFRVVAMDFPGYGKSGPAGDKLHSVADMATDVWSLYREIGTNVAIVGGLSVGARVAKQFVLDYQPHVRALLLAGCGAGTTIRSQMQGNIDGYRNKGLAYRRESIEGLLAPQFAASDLGCYLVSLFMETNPTTDMGSIIKNFEALLEFNITDRLHEIKVPTIIISGEEDRALPRARELTKAIAGSEHHVIKGAGHACAMEKPWEFDALVLAFLKKHGLLPQAAPLSF